MKKKLSIGIFTLVLLGAGFLLWPRHQEKSYAGVVAQLTPAQVHVQTAKLEKIIIPPDGVPLQDVEAVYGKTSLNDPSKIIKGKREVLHYLHCCRFQKEME